MANATSAKRVLLALVVLSLTRTALPRAESADQPAGATPADSAESSSNKQRDRREASQRRFDKATALVAETEPLRPPTFERTHGPIIEYLAESTWITFTYQVHSTELRGQKLVTEIKRLFAKNSWTAGSPPGMSFTANRADGSQMNVIAFHKEPLLRSWTGTLYCHRWARIVISDDEASLRCTYSFPD